jgi:hypothetical protein
MSPFELQLTEKGYLHLPAELARRYFPSDTLVPLVRGSELLLLPTRGAAAGGLLLKQRNAAGDRSVLIWEVLPLNIPPGTFKAVWDEGSGALRIALE